MENLKKLINTQLRGRDIYDSSVLHAMYSVDRALFVPSNLKHFAYEDTPLPIGFGQSISQPYIVAYMAQCLDPDPDDRVLEIGSGSGYNAAVLSRLVNQVYSVEIIEELAIHARLNLDKANISNVRILKGDGNKGWPQKAPFDKIVLTAAVPRIPEVLKDQLKVGGKIIAPVTRKSQKLIMLEKISDNMYEEYDMIYVSFLPLVTRNKELWYEYPV